MNRSTSILRIENTAIALLCLITPFTFGYSWWLLFAAFLFFDLSALGYLKDSRIGALGYNLVHNYTGPVIVLFVYTLLWATDRAQTWVLVLGMCWAFHIAVDRALGYGLKLGSFASTHLGHIGPKS